MFEYERRIGMRDADAAGIMFFARFLSLVHEAYEEMLARRGIGFRDQIDKHGIILPIVHVEADYRQPLFVEDNTTICLAITDVKNRSYTVAFQFLLDDGRVAAEGKIIHASVNYATRTAAPLPEPLVQVLKACA